MISVRLGFFLKTGQAALGMARALWPCFVAALLALKSTTSTSSAPWDLCSPLQHPLHLKQECKAQGASGHKEFHVSCRKEIIYRTLQVTAPSTTNWTWLCWSVQLPQKSHSAMGRMETRNRICVSSCSKESWPALWALPSSPSCSRCQQQLALNSGMPRNCSCPSAVHPCPSWIYRL